jgi:hypothetical protein
MQHSRCRGIIVGRCGRIDLVAYPRGRINSAFGSVFDTGRLAAWCKEDVMTRKISAAGTLPVLLAAAGLVVAGFATDPADAAPKKQRIYGTSDQVAYGSGGPNASYQSGPRTRVFITKRSWLDAGTEVLPGERHFTDYAYAPGYSFARENYNRPIDRQPLNPPSDFGFGPAFRPGIPLPPY